MKQFLATGVIRSPHGVKGFVKVHSYSGSTDHFSKIKTVQLQKNDKTKTLEIESVQKSNGELFIKFSGIDSPEEARFISGWDILVPREQASKLGKGKVYIADLISMKLIYDNEEVGVVESVLDGTQAPLLEVRCKDDKIRIVPYIKKVFVDDVDVEKQTMTLLKRELLQ